MSTSFIRRLFRLIAGFAILAAAGMVILIFCTSRDERRLPKPEACPVVSNVIETIVQVFAANGDYLRFDVRKMTCAEFEERLRDVSDAATLWTPGEGDWLIIGADHGCSNTLEKVTDAFVEASTAFSLPEIMANYVGTVGEIRPAFSALNPEDGVVPELFVSKDIPDFAWLRNGEVDRDLAVKTRQEMRSMQVVRRLVLEGDMLSRQQQEDAAIAKWESAFRRAPNDTLLLERMHHLRRNAEVFYKIGKFGMACKCYETLFRINTRDYVAAVSLSECLKCLGKRELAEAVRRKAETIKVHFNKE